MWWCESAPTGSNVTLGSAAKPCQVAAGSAPTVATAYGQHLSGTRPAENVSGDGPTRRVRPRLRPVHPGARGEQLRQSAAVRAGWGTQKAIVPELFTTARGPGMREGAGCGIRPPLRWCYFFGAPTSTAVVPAVSGPTIAPISAAAS